MSAHSDMNTALVKLRERLQSLNDLVTANHFMVEAMARQQEDLRQMGGAETRAMLRQQAREKFHPDTGATPNAAALAVLEQALSQQQQHSAEIIPFPQRREG